MISIDRSIRPCVCDCSGLRFSVQLMYSARRSLKSYGLSSTIRSCISFSAISSLTGLLLDRGLRSGSDAPRRGVTRSAVAADLEHPHGDVVVAAEAALAEADARV